MKNVSFEENCTITYTPTEKKDVVIALEIEDFQDVNSKTPLSGTSLQFIVSISSENKPICEKRKFFSHNEKR